MTSTEMEAAFNRYLFRLLRMGFDSDEARKLAIVKLDHMLDPENAHG